MEKLSVKEISEKLKISSVTLRTWLGNFRFDKYRVANCHPAKYKYTKGFLLDLKDYIDRKPSVAAYKVLNFIDELLEGEE